MTANHRSVDLKHDSTPAPGTPPGPGTAPERGTARGRGGVPGQGGASWQGGAPGRGFPGDGRRRGPEVKRVFDLVAGTALLLLVSPVLAGAALLLTLAQEGPALRRRTVAGLRGRPFTMLTLRTRSPLAALPLLLHVVRGQMSLVGPCPLSPTHRECSGETRRRLSVRPGMTGPWQISDRSDLPWEERELLDLHYVDHHWLGMDLAVLARTLPAVRRRRLRRASARPARLA
ncbi:sugar transferase [Streptomyces sp. NRRL F-5727]|uniref:sugar transferase n=1 Tax=Streptomyces sp. NRRL F-5727 TaxID=1463871 RepID=UPI00099B852B|nr:sugar transferase [Streptomyces sp. NRRL F-5727]